MDDLEMQMDYLLRFVAPIAPMDHERRGVRILRAGEGVWLTWEGGPLVCAPTVAECVRIAAMGEGWRRAT